MEKTNINWTKEQTTITLHKESFNKLKEIQQHLVKRGRNARWQDVIDELYGLYKKHHIMDL